MATPQRRYHCHGCDREFVSALSASGHWQEGEPCVVCGSLDIEMVDYDAAFPGGDIPRGGTVQEELARPTGKVEALVEARTAWPVRPTPDPPATLGLPALVQAGDATLLVVASTPHGRRSSAFPEFD